MNAQYDILMHACCGPCLEWPANQLMQEGSRLLVWYYNPNVQPLVENQRRADNLRLLTQRLRLDCLIESGCEPEVWQSWQDAEESRCQMCYRRRLQAAAEKARDLGIPAFSTSLLVSPYQDQAAILAIGQAAAVAAGVAFIGRDFRAGYRQGQQMAREDGLYRQKYCGCLPSLEQSDFKAKIKHDLEVLSGLPAEFDNDHK